MNFAGVARTAVVRRMEVRVVDSPASERLELLP